MFFCARIAMAEKYLVCVPGLPWRESIWYVYQDCHGGESVWYVRQDFYDRKMDHMAGIPGLYSLGKSLIL